MCAFTVCVCVCVCVCVLPLRLCLKIKLIESHNEGERMCPCPQDSPVCFPFFPLSLCHTSENEKPYYSNISIKIIYCKIKKICAVCIWAYNRTHINITLSSSLSTYSSFHLSLKLQSNSNSRVFPCLQLRTWLDCSSMPPYSWPYMTASPTVPVCEWHSPVFRSVWFHDILSVSFFMLASAR